MAKNIIHTNLSFITWSIIKSFQSLSKASKSTLRPLLSSKSDEFLLVNHKPLIVNPRSPDGRLVFLAPSLWDKLSCLAQFINGCSAVSSSWQNIMRDSFSQIHSHQLLWITCLTNFSSIGLLGVGWGSWCRLWAWTRFRSVVDLVVLVLNPAPL